MQNAKRRVDGNGLIETLKDYIFAFEVETWKSQILFSGKAKKFRNKLAFL